jgi:hypothetical protein
VFRVQRFRVHIKSEPIVSLVLKEKRVQVELFYIGCAVQGSTFRVENLQPFHINRILSSACS